MKCSQKCQTKRRAVFLRAEQKQKKKSKERDRIFVLPPDYLFRFQPKHLSQEEIKELHEKVGKTEIKKEP